LQHADDDVIFERAAAEHRIVVSADADFGTLLALRSSRQPSVIQFRGEGSRKPDALARTLLANLPQLVDALENGSTGRAAELHQERAAVRTPYAGIST
jgi:predicted nuclease of predicted toxin-antitoxin system